jgi:hypothetical protein
MDNGSRDDSVARRQSFGASLRRDLVPHLEARRHQQIAEGAVGGAARPLGEAERLA